MGDNTSEHAIFPAKSTHDRRTSTFTGSNALTTDIPEQQTQLTCQKNASQEHRQPLDLPESPDSETSSPIQDIPILPSPNHNWNQIQAMLLNIIRKILGEFFANAFAQADKTPPITQESLAELDMPRIINNPKLRHDVNFDRELHFRPNLDGTKGKQKLRQAELYWKALEAEFCLYSFISSKAKENAKKEADWDRVMKQSLIRLEGIFKAIRDIMKTLVPDYDQKAVDERLDVDHVMQQIRNGVCDLIDLANWLAKILKRHCAPMRDQLVDNMRKEIESGVHENQNSRLVSGLRQLMTILEAMKLDVANHQIRHMRPLLIDDTVNFQRRYNEHRIKIEKIRPFECKTWLENEMKEPTFTEDSTPLTPLDAYCSALIADVVFKNEELMCPQAFYLDIDRLQSLRIELHSMACHEVCREIFQELAGPSIDPARMTGVYEMLHGSISAIVGARGKFVDRPENIAAEMVRVLLVMEGRYPHIDDKLMSEAESKLKDRLRPQSDAFKSAATKICERVIPKIRRRVSSLVKKPAIVLHNELVPITIPRPSILGFGAICEPVPMLPAQPSDPDDDLVRRVTHMLVLHWQVWWNLVYMIKDPSQDEETSSSDQDPPSATSSTVPVAQAVYDEHKWMPTALKVTNVPQLPTPSPSPPPETNHSSSSSTPGSNEQNGEEASN